MVRGLRPKEPVTNSMVFSTAVIPYIGIVILRLPVGDSSMALKDNVMHFQWASPFDLVRLHTMVFCLKLTATTTVQSARVMAMKMT